MSRTVGARELKTRLGTYLSMVRKGITLVVTDRGRPVAELRPIETPSDSLSTAINEMVALGEVSRGSDTELDDFTPARVQGAPLSETIVDDRKDRM